MKVRFGRCRVFQRASSDGLAPLTGPPIKCLRCLDQYAQGHSNLGTVVEGGSVRHRRQHLRPLATSPMTMKQAEKAGCLLGIHWATVYRLRRRFLVDPVASRSSPCRGVRRPSASHHGPPMSSVAPRMERPPPLPRPSREEIELLPPYEQLAPDRIHLIRGDKQADFVLRCLADAGFVGFDTETKPVFTPGAQPNGPHLIQLATLDRAFIFQVGSTPPQDFLREALESSHLVKVGFGLKSDRAPMFRKFGIYLGGSIEMAQIVRKLGFRQAVGVKAAVAIVLGQRLQKSKNTTKSNWALPVVSQRMV